MSARSKLLAPVATVVAVVAVAGTAALISHGSGPGKPPRLHLAAGNREAAGLAAPAATADAKMAGGGYTLVGSLPSGTPGDGRAYSLPRGVADEDVVAKLAQALGVSAPVKGKDGWTAGGLTVSATSGQAWWWSPCYSPDGSISNAKEAVCSIAIADSSGGTSVGSGSAPAVGAPDAPVVAPPAPSALLVAPPVACSIAAPSDGATLSPEEMRKAISTCPQTRPVPAPPPVCEAPLPPGATTVQPSCPTPSEPEPLPEPSSSAVRAAAAPVFASLGIDAGQARVQTYPGGGSVTVDPKVDGLDTVGLSTSIGVDSKGAITNANGWLSVPDAGDRYPLISARKTFDALPSYARLASCPVGPDGQGCTEPEPQEVTGAHLGLSVASLTDNDLALLPTWLFDVKGQDFPLAGIAVDPSYLDQGAPATIDPGVVPPGEPTSSDPAPTTQVSLTSWSPSKADNAVTVTYTTDGCGLSDVAADVKEDAKQVYVFLHGIRPGPDVACTEIAQQQTFQVALQDPLGDRTVVDGNTGAQVPKA